MEPIRYIAYLKEENGDDEESAATVVEIFGNKDGKFVLHIGYYADDSEYYMSDALTFTMSEFEGFYSLMKLLKENYETETIDDEYTTELAYNS